MLATFANESNVAIHEMIESPGQYASIINTSLQFRETLLSGEEENALGGYLAIGFFAGWSRRARLASFAMTFDVQHEATRLSLRAQCEPYSQTRPLFQNEPSLFERIRRKESGSQDYELIDLVAVRSVSGSEVYKAGSGFTKLCPFVSG